MSGVKETVYTPIPENVAIYAQLFALYTDLHDAFGKSNWSGSLSRVMKHLIEIRNKARNS
jgi:L-ribulokinase